MSVKWSRIGTGFLLLMFIMGCAFPYINDSRQEARKVVIITIDVNKRQEFFDQLRKFAEANGFSILIDTMSSSNEKFQIYMTRDDVIISGASPFEPYEYHLAFSDANVRHAAPDSVFDDLLSELERYASAVPGTTFLIEK